MPTVNVTGAPLQNVGFRREDDPAAPNGFNLFLQVEYVVETDDARFKFRRGIQRVLTGSQRTTVLGFLSDIQAEVNTAEGLP